MVEKFGRREWKKQAGHHRQRSVEHAFLRYETMLGGKLHTRSLSTQKAGAVRVCKIVNRMLARGRSKSVASTR
jgi:hypothetical protein